MTLKAQQRWNDDKAKFVVYDGFKFPFEDEYFDVIYSVATIQHIEKNIAFLLFREIFRVLKTHGHAILHFLAVDHIPNSIIPFDEECWNHINGKKNTHWHHYYSYDELFVLFSKIIGVDELDIRFDKTRYFVHFSKGTGNKIKRKELIELFDVKKKLL